MTIPGSAALLPPPTVSLASRPALATMMVYLTIDD
jgi:hypothetical protein